jgi:hypothetical protein
LLHDPKEEITSYHVSVAVCHLFSLSSFSYTSDQKHYLCQDHFDYSHAFLHKRIFLFESFKSLFFPPHSSIATITIPLCPLNPPLIFPSSSLSTHVLSSHDTTNPAHSYYTSLSPKTRLMVGGGIIGYACLGLFLADTAEEKLGYTPTEEDKKRLREALPKIRVVDEFNTRG